MVVAASGVTDLCGLLADGQGVEGGDDLALAITFTVFGIPMVAVVAAWVRRDLRRGPDERQSAGWAAYVTLASLTTLIVAMSAAGELVSAVLGGHFTQWAVVARLLVWGLLWWVHWLFSERLPSESRRQPHRALGSLIGLCASIAGLTWLLGSAVTTMMGDDGGAVVVGVHDELAAAAGCFAAGVAV